MLFRYYRQLVAQVEQWTGEMNGRYSAYLACRKGCDACCQRKFTVTAVEAYNIALAYRKLAPEIRLRVEQPKASCAFLVDGACSVYESRPIICRTFGLPSLHRDDNDEGVVTWCDLNFTTVGEGFALQPDGIIDVDTLNTKLTGVNGLFVRESGLADRRFEMEEIHPLDPGPQSND